METKTTKRGPRIVGSIGKWCWKCNGSGRCYSMTGIGSRLGRCYICNGTKRIWKRFEVAIGGKP